MIEKEELEKLYQHFRRLAEIEDSLSYATLTINSDRTGVVDGARKREYNNFQELADILNEPGDKVTLDVYALRVKVRTSYNTTWAHILDDFPETLGHWEKNEGTGKYHCEFFDNLELVVTPSSKGIDDD